MTGLRQQERVAAQVRREMMDREWGRCAAQAALIAQHDAAIAQIDSIQASIARADALLAHNAALLNQKENG